MGIVHGGCRGVRLYNRNCAINPYLIEGKKTVSLELVEQFRTLTPGSFPIGS